MNSFRVHGRPHQYIIVIFLLPKCTQKMIGLQTAVYADATARRAAASSVSQRIIMLVYIISLTHFSNLKYRFLFIDFLYLRTKRMSHNKKLKTKTSNNVPMSLTLIDIDRDIQEHERQLQVLYAQRERITNKDRPPCSYLC